MYIIHGYFVFKYSAYSSPRRCWGAYAIPLTSYQDFGADSKAKL